MKLNTVRIFRSRSCVTRALSLTAICAGVSLTSCKTRNFESAVKIAESEQKVYKACMGIQGNGVLFSSHLGTLTALFENSIDPAIIVGGSSGSIVGSIGRALMTNVSIKNSKVKYKTSRGEVIELSQPQRAALVLAAAEDVMNAFLFLPGLDDVWKATDGFLTGRDNENSFVTYLLNFKANLTKGGQLPAEAMTKILNIEPTVGSAVLLTAFFQLTDFSQLFEMSNRSLQGSDSSGIDGTTGSDPDYLQEFRNRKDWIRKSFVNYTQADKWSMAEVISLMTDPTTVLEPWGITPAFIKNVRAAKKEKFGKLKRLFAEDPVFVKENSFSEDEKLHVNMMGNVFVGVLWWAGHKVFQTADIALVQSFGELFKKIGKEDPNYGTKLNRILNGEFMLADPDLIADAYQGFVPDPSKPKSKIFFPVPEGMIIHSTFTKGSVSKREGVKRDFWADFDQREVQPKISGTVKEFTLGKLKKFDIFSFESEAGFQNLYQGYIVGSKLGQDAALSSEDSLFKQMQSRRNSAWADWKQAGESWKAREADVVKDGYKRAPFLLYKFESLENARGAISLQPVTNLGLKMLAEVAPLNRDLEGGWMESYLPPRQVLLFDQVENSVNGDFRNRGLNFGIQASAGEPGAFRRYAIKWTERDKKLNSFDGNGIETALDQSSSKTAGKPFPEGFEEARLVPFGGWGENVPLSTVMHLKECQDADIFVSSAKDAPGNDFQSGALRAVVSGQFKDREQLNSNDPRSSADVQEVAGHFQRLTAAALYSRGLPGKIWVHNDMNFDKPCAIDSSEKKNACSESELEVINNAIVPLPWGESRINLAFVGYQTTIASIRGANRGNDAVLAELKRNLGQFNAYGQNLQNETITDLAHWSSSKSFWGFGRSKKVPENVKAYMDAARLGQPVPRLK